jgi:hypothetical protein
MFWTQNKKSTWALEMQHLYQNEDPFYNPDLLRDPFPFLGLIQVKVVLISIKTVL